MEIILVRHGRPQQLATGRITGREFGAWVRQYDAAGIDRSLCPPAELQMRARACACILASDRLRSIQSAQWLAANGKTVQTDGSFREAGLPESIPIPIRLTPSACMVIARALWWLTWCDADEPIAATRERAGRAAETLLALAREHGSVMLVGHGMFNRFLAARLKTQGWRGPRHLPSSYWSAASFTC